MGTGWPRECVRMLVDMVFECKGYGWVMNGKMDKTWVE